MARGAGWIHSMAVARDAAGSAACGHSAARSTVRLPLLLLVASSLWRFHGSVRIGEAWFGLATATAGLPKCQSIDALLVISKIMTGPIFAVTLDPENRRHLSGWSSAKLMRLCLD